MAAASPSCSATRRRDGYERRRPEDTLLYQFVETHWPKFRERAEQVGGLPKFVVDEFEAYLRCGILEHGLAHFACRRCGQSRAVAWSCKARGFFPSCIARRMSDCAAHLVDEVLPRVPARQWVASLPWQLRYAMGYDAKLCSAVLAEFMRALRRSLRRRAKLALGLRSVEEAKFGAVTMIQRADSSLRLNVHFHCLVLDGVYVGDAEGQLCFHTLPRPTPEEVAEVARWTHEGIARVLARHGRTLGGFDDAVDELADEQPALASCYSASVSDRLGLRSVDDALFGAVTFIQRGDSSLRLNVHFHCLVLGGVYVRDDEGALCFHELGGPTHEELTDVARWTHERLGVVLERHGRSLEELAGDDAADRLRQEPPVLASCYGASAADRQLLGDAPGQQTRKLAHAVRAVAKPNDAVAEVGGVPRSGWRPACWPESE